MTQALPHSDRERPPLLCALQRLRGKLRLDGELPHELWQRALLGPAEEMLARPGKLFRGRLTELVARGVGPARPLPEELAWVVELLHAGSLIIDDVQDGSAERRGGPALHRMVGVPLAINTGNWLYFAALALVEELPLPAPARGEILRATVTALMRCHHGQALDLAIHVGHLEPRQLPAVVAATTRDKTGVLMGLAARLGAVAAGVSGERAEALACFGEELGVGLQMLDDLGSLCAPDRRSKGHEDLRAGRPTWPWAWLAEHSDELKVARLQQRLRAQLAHREPGERADEATAELSALGDELAAATAEPGRAALRAQLARAMELGRAHLDAAVHRELAGELARLEASYG